MTDRLLTVPEVAELLHCSRRSVERLIASGRIRPTKVGSLTRVTEKELAAYIAHHTGRRAA